MTQRLSRDEQREQNRTRILEAAERTFLEVGFHAASIEQIADRAGFTKGAFYSNFANKAEVFYAVLEQIIDEPAREVAHKIPQGLALGDQTEQAGLAFNEIFLGDPAWSLLLMEFAVYVSRDEELRVRFAERNRRVRTTMTTLIQEHIDGLGLRLNVPAESLASILFALGTGVILDKVVDPDAVSQDLFPTAIMLLFGSSIANPPAS
jgi:AcrR family transcriptional regulator